ncbi:MAG: squalene/phytoene synthase family protein [Alphaproteobacteria bacterium]|nr:squalene/phytoene synthase family protein [Alphaproteobacteria bacterium]MBO6863267.1 squalene/phytoene synthase family protein [Alphaproteobacteria bacterium]
MKRAPEQTIDPPQLAARITRESASNLWFVGQALDARKRRLFEASYASMRVIDDFVDDDFLSLSEADRETRRPTALTYVETWRDAAMDVLAGSAPRAGLNERDRTILEALRLSASVSDVPPDPWQHLAEAMAFDVREGRLETWADFDRYCEGATVAPATVFLYVLQAQRSGDEGLCAARSAESLAAQARDMAIFCYLVHIMRDFAKDAARGGQLITIPRVCFETHGIDRETVTAVSGRALDLLRDLSERADRRRIAARAMADGLIPALGSIEGRILNALLTIYERMHDSLKVDPSPSRDRASLTENLRTSLARQLGLALP